MQGAEVKKLSEPCDEGLNNTMKDWIVSGIWRKKLTEAHLVIKRVHKIATFVETAARGSAELLSGRKAM